MQYLTYDEYKAIGGVLDLAAFNRNIQRACAYLDSQTFNRLRKGSQSVKVKTDPISWDALIEGIELEVPVNTIVNASDSVKACVRDLVEYFNENVTAAKTITSKSQSAGGVSESESYGAKTKEQVDQELSNIVFDYLSAETDQNGTPLLYRGAME